MKSPLSLLREKIRVKVFALILAVLLLCLVIINLGSYSILFRAFTGTTYSELCSIADTVSSFIPDSDAYYIDVFSLAENHNADLEIVDPDGFLVYTTQGAGSALSSSHFSTSGSTTPQYAAMQDSSNSSRSYGHEDLEVKRKTATNADYFVYSRLLATGNTLHVFTPLASVENIVSTASRVFSLFSVVIIFIIGLAFFIIASRFTKPVEEINNVTKDMAALDFSRKCDDYGKDEIGELGRSINTLSDTLNETLLDLKDKNIQLEKDIELRLALDNARKSFISNVSHELKTPIAIISGYAEALSAGISSDPEVIKEYCSIINDESSKMNELVLELLELSKLESKTAPFTPDYYDIGESVANIIGHLSLQFEKNGITVTNNVPLSLECYAQGDKIEIVLKNYITNAVSHCSGEKKISVDCLEKEKTIEISVFNTGSPIADVDMPEIWDSFYRADKAHGRSENRFGLGLSIVKSIMENHGCAFGAENTGSGVIFRFEVAKNSDYYEKNENV